jgi:hypothetical protein
MPMLNLESFKDNFISWDLVPGAGHEGQALAGDRLTGEVLVEELF